MTKKDKVINNFLSDLFKNEEIKSLNIQTKKNLSNLIKEIEKTNIKTISIFPKLKDELIDSSDLYIFLDDINFTENDIGTAKNLISNKILVFIKLENQKEIDPLMLKLGFITEFYDARIKLCCYSYNLSTYNNKRDWNNSEGWANPENFNKFRW